MTNTAPAPLTFVVEAPPGASDESERTVVLIHGFPDNPAVWRLTCEYLVGRGLRVVLVTLPGFDTDHGRAGCVTFDETVDRLHQTLFEAGALGATVVGHDWGAIFSYMLLTRYPESASRLVLLPLQGRLLEDLLARFFVEVEGLLCGGVQFLPPPRQ